MSIAECIASVVIVYWFARLIIPVMEWHEIERYERRRK